MKGRSPPLLRQSSNWERIESAGAEGAAPEGDRPGSNWERIERMLGIICAAHSTSPAATGKELKARRRRASARLRPRPAATGKELKASFGFLGTTCVSKGSNWERIERHLHFQRVVRRLPHLPGSNWERIESQNLADGMDVIVRERDGQQLGKN